MKRSQRILPAGSRSDRRVLLWLSKVSGDSVDTSERNRNCPTGLGVVSTFFKKSVFFIISHDIWYFFTNPKKIRCSKNEAFPTDPTRRLQKWPQSLALAFESIWELCRHFLTKPEVHNWSRRCCTSFWKKKRFFIISHDIWYFFTNPKN